MSITSDDRQVRVPVDLVADDPEKLRAHLHAHGWADDGKMLRFQGQGKRTLPAAAQEQRARELEELRRMLPSTDDELLLRRCLKSNLNGLANAAARNPRVGPELLQLALEAGNLEAVAGSPHATEEMLRGVLARVSDRRQEMRLHSLLVASPAASFELRRELLEPQLTTPISYTGELYWERSLVEDAARSSDPEMLRFLTGEALSRYADTPVHRLDARRDCEAILFRLAGNEAAPPDILEQLAALDHVEVDRVLLKNRLLPAFLFQRLEPQCREIVHGNASLRAIAALPYHGRRIGWDGERATTYRCLWLDLDSISRSRSNPFEQHPEGAFVQIAALGDDLIVAGPRRADHLDSLEDDLGTLLWVPVTWPRSPEPLHYRGFNHGLTDFESGRFLRLSGRSIIAAWPQTLEAYLSACPEALVYQAHRIHLRSHEEALELAVEGLQRGANARQAAQAVNLRVPELRAAATRLQQRERERIPRWRDEMRETRLEQTPALSVRYCSSFHHDLIQLSFADGEEEHADALG